MPNRWIALSRIQMGSKVYQPGDEVTDLGPPMIGRLFRRRLIQRVNTPAVSGTPEAVGVPTPAPEPVTEPVTDTVDENEEEEDAVGGTEADPSP